MSKSQSFRSVAIPPELLEGILLVPEEKGECLHIPIIKIERILSYEQAKKMTANEDARYKIACQTFGVDFFENQTTLTFKDCLVRRDISLLADLIATDFRSRISKWFFDWNDLYQLVEIGWSFRDFYPKEKGAIHYEIFTKRDLRIRSD